MTCNGRGCAQICNPKIAKQLLDLDFTALTVLPCRFALHEDPSTHETVIRYLQPEVLLAPFALGDDTSEMFAFVTERLTGIIHEITAPVAAE